MFPLVGLAHGSRDPRASVSTAELMAAVGAARPGLVAVPAYLDLAEPDLADAVCDLADNTVVVLPLLFTQAFHARVDTPAEVAAAAAASGKTLITAPLLGMGTAVQDALDVRAAEAGIPATGPIALAAVGSADEDANRAVADLAARWSARRGSPVTACFATAGEPKVGPVVAGLGSDGGVVPLFLAPGLLLRTIADHAATAGVPVAEPLGTLMAGLVLARYDEAVAQFVLRS